MEGLQGNGQTEEDFHFSFCDEGSELRLGNVSKLFFLLSGCLVEAREVIAPAPCAFLGLLLPNSAYLAPQHLASPQHHPRSALRVVRGRSSPVSCQRPVGAAALSLLQCHVRMLPQWRQRDRCAPDASNRCVLPRGAFRSRAQAAPCSILLASLHPLGSNVS